ncbi:MAG: hypothetical protein LBC83_02685 [Oscillospiraceae bacterium]|nr:hypothetical protein [Oscillospiraceae bacterium]
MLASTDAQKVFSSAQLLARFVQEMQEPVCYIRTGMHKLDYYAQMDRGDYVIVGGRPSSGKTAFTLQMMLEMAKNYRIAYFSLETRPEKLFHRCVANRSGISLRTFKRHELDDPGERALVSEVMEEYVDKTFHVISAAGWTVEQVRAAAVRLKLVSTFNKDNTTIRTIYYLLLCEFSPREMVRYTEAMTGFPQHWTDLEV